MKCAFHTGVTIAIPVSQERNSPVLNTACRLLLVTRRRGKQAGRKEFLLGPLDTESLAGCIAELHIDVLLCAALSEALQRALIERGVQVRSHLCGEVEAVLQAFCRGRLRRPEFRMPGCWGWHTESGCCRRRAAQRPQGSGMANDKKSVEKKSVTT